MKIQSKISLLLACVVGVFLAGVVSIRYTERARFRRIAEERYVERHRSFETFLESYGTPLRTLVEDLTCDDQMVRAIANHDTGGLERDLNESSLAGFQANAVWVFAQDSRLLYAVDNLHGGAPLDLPLPPGALAQIFARQALAHFFLQLPQGLIEIRAGTVHPSKDFRRQSPAYGYVFAGRLWSKPAPDGRSRAGSVIGEMSMFTGNEVRLIPAGAPVASVSSEEQNGLIVFSRALPDWTGRPLARLAVKNDSPVVRGLNRSTGRLLVALILFALVLLFVLWFSLNRWVHRPLHQIMRSLQRDNPEPIEQLREEGSEFGALARTVHTFFEQRRNLRREMTERHATEEALRKSEDELRHAQKLEAVGRLAGGVAHDFNNLLTAIIGYAELVAERADHPALVRQNAAMIRKAGGQAAGLTRQLLAFSRKQLLQPRVIDLNRLVVEMEQLLRRVIGERYELRTLPEAERGRVKADPSQLEQVILNLGVNGRDAMPGGGRLTIRTANVTLDPEEAERISPSLGAGVYVVLEVEDRGQGMDEETKSKIFEPFFTTKGPGKGTGLGLATVYGIVRQSGGAIAVESALGQGSIFRIYFPAEEAPLEEPRAAPAPVEPSHRSETVLVVEDEEIVRELVCDVLTQQGYAVICAANGADALQMAEQHSGRIDLLVTDVVMPQMNGHELAERLTALQPGLNVLFVSGYSEDDIGEHGVLDTTIELLEKPFTPQSLSRKVREILGEAEEMAARSGRL